MTIGERLAILETELKAVKATVDDLDQKMEKVTDSLNISRGKRIAYGLLGAVATTLIGIALWAIDHLSAR